MSQRIAVDDSKGLIYTYDGVNRSGTWAFAGNAWVRQDTWIYDGVDHPLEHDDNQGNRQYYELDLAGNVRRLMGSGGADLGGYRYTAFGETVTDGTAPQAPQGVNALPVRWKGRWLLYSANVGAPSGVELYDMRARLWWPQGGVFVQVDGLAFHSMTTTLWGWPHQNPLARTDVSGHMGDPIASNPAEWASLFSPEGKKGMAIGAGAGLILALAAPEIAAGVGTASAWAASSLGLGAAAAGAGGNALNDEGEAVCEAGVTVTQEGLATVTKHLEQFGEWGPNQAMLSRLQAALGSTVSGADANFYQHELSEAASMAEGMSQEAAHAAALEQAGVSPFSLYHPEVIQQFPEEFNSNWRAFWGL